METNTDTLLHTALFSIKQAIDDAKQFGSENSNCGFLATTGENKQPSVRMITILQLSDQGLLFLANKHSGKVKQFSANPSVGLCFYWPEIQMQATIEGNVRELNHEASEALWQRRDYHAQITAWAIDNMADGQANNEQSTLDKESVRDRFSGSRPPLAKSWAGYILEPSRIEFWGTDWRKNKKRQCYMKTESRWKISEYY